MFSFKKKNYFQFLFILSFIVLLSAYAIQYLLGYQPCSLCLIERIPYVFAIIILIINYQFRTYHVFYSVLLILIFSFSFIISLYHFGIEQGFIEESSLCDSGNLELITKEDILNSFQKMRISCKDVAFRILGLSLTTYNIFISLILILISIKTFLISNEK